MKQTVDFYVGTFVSCAIVFSLTKTTFAVLNKIDLLETKLEAIKERINDLELFKLKVYNNEAVPGRRAWDEIDIEFEEDEELD